MLFVSAFRKLLVFTAGLIVAVSALAGHSPASGAPADTGQQVGEVALVPVPECPYHRQRISSTRVRVYIFSDDLRRLLRYYGGTGLMLVGTSGPAGTHHYRFGVSRNEQFDVIFNDVTNQSTISIAITNRNNTTTICRSTWSE